MILPQSELADQPGMDRERSASAAKRPGRDPDAIRLVGVSDWKPSEDIPVAHEFGQMDFDKNCVQEFKTMSSVMPLLSGTRCRRMGRLWSKKAKRVARLFTMIYAPDTTLMVRLGVGTVESKAAS